MRTLTVISAAVASCALAGAAHGQAVRHYDCSKPGNANKSVCKDAAAPTVPATPSTPIRTAAPAKAERHYDCSKAGNANKAACKGVAPAPATAAIAPAAPAPTAKPSILDRLRGHRATAAASPAAATPAAPAATPSARASASAAPVGSYMGKSITTDPTGATGQCKDGTYTHATHHSGACSSHGGVAKWM